MENERTLVADELRMLCLEREEKAGERDPAPLGPPGAGVGAGTRGGLASGGGPNPQFLSQGLKCSIGVRQRLVPGG